jgi:hypothetical protein
MQQKKEEDNKFNTKRQQEASGEGIEQDSSLSYGLVALFYRYTAIRRPARNREIGKLKRIGRK